MTDDFGLALGDRVLDETPVQRERAVAAASLGRRFELIVALEDGRPLVARHATLRPRHRAA